jgi:hypothetical protein
MSFRINLAKDVMVAMRDGVGRPSQVVLPIIPGS